jgi:hypothetical protein
LAVQEPEHIFLSARNAQEMQHSQSQLASWLETKHLSCKGEAKELEVALKHARENKWATKTLQSAACSARRRERYYEKLALAVRAGYTLIPAMGWVDVFAVRVKRASAQLFGADTKYTASIPDQRTDSPPAGEGRYVSTESEGIIHKHTQVEEGTQQIIRWGEATDFREVEFPLNAAKSELMSATAQAMALKVFDEIGIAPNRRGKDPFILGTIKGPQYKQAVFVIAWYLDTRAL